MSELIPISKDVETVAQTANVIIHKLEQENASLREQLVKAREDERSAIIEILKNASKTRACFHAGNNGPMKDEHGNTVFIAASKIEAAIDSIVARAALTDETRDAPASGSNPVSKDGSMAGRGVDPTLRGATSPTLSKMTIRKNRRRATCAGDVAAIASAPVSKNASTSNTRRNQIDDGAD